MNRRSLSIALLALLASSVSLPVFGKDGEDDSGDDENSGNSGSGGNNSGEDEPEDDPGEDEEVPGVEPPEDDGGSHGDHDDARHAVEAEDALPLSTILARFQAYGDYTIIDVKLVRRDNVLIYVFKFIDSEGKVRKAFFDAKTGELVN